MLGGRRGKEEEERGGGGERKDAKDAFKFSVREHIVGGRRRERRATPKYPRSCCKSPETILEERERERKKKQKLLLLC